MPGFSELALRLTRTTRLPISLGISIFITFALVLITRNSHAAPAAPAEVEEYVQTVILHADDADPGDNLGYAIAMDGDTVVVGAVSEDGGGGDPLPNAGAAYVFERNLGGPNQWGLAAKLSASDAQAGDRFGDSVAIHGDTIVVGAEEESGGDGDPIFLAGAAYVFERNLGGSNQWGQSIQLTASDAGIAYFFGHSVAVYDDTIVIGAYGSLGDPGDPDTSAGSAYVFERDAGGAGQWGEVQILYSGDAVNSGWFGYSVALDTNMLVIGAANENGPVADSGAVYILERATEGGGAWTQIKRLVSAEAESGGFFGYVVDISGDVVLVGAPNENGDDGNPFSQAGTAYVFERDKGGPDVWGLSAMLNAPDPNKFGAFGVSVSVAGSRAIVGGSGDDGDGGVPVEAVGAVFLFESSSGSWLLKEILRHTNIDEFDRLGASVAVSNETIAAGATGEDYGTGNPIASAGAAIVFQELNFENQLFLPLVVRP